MQIMPPTGRLRSLLYKRHVYKVIHISPPEDNFLASDLHFMDIRSMLNDFRLRNMPMSVLSELWEAAPNQLISRGENPPDNAQAEYVKVPHDAQASSQIANTERFNRMVTDGPGPERHLTSNRLNLFIDHLIIDGKIATMDSGVVTMQHSMPDPAKAEQIYRKTSNALEPKQPSRSVTAYLESIPPRLNVFGVPGDIDN
jgi:hypothetical protein